MVNRPMCLELDIRLGEGIDREGAHDRDSEEEREDVYFDL